MPATHVFETCIDFQLGIGESPVWDDELGLLWFVDIDRPAAYSFDPATKRTVEHRMPQAIGSLGLVSGGKLIVALRSGIHFYDPLTRALEFLVHPEPDRVMNRLNDGRVGPDGCFWVGSMHDAQPRQPTACFYRVTPEGTVTTVLEGLCVSNGLAWSPDGRIMYHADTRSATIRAFDFDPSGGDVSNERTFAVLDREAGLPDGAAVDVEGCYWSAGVTSGRLNRFSPDGTFAYSIDLPTDAPTMPCFGGHDLKTMFVTSLTGGKAGSPGTLISFRVDVAGLPSERMSVG